mmetsp:Transcript_48677/g.136934  ORF Transcript_48677/g.136934 Transcript_48677/m.136934 type:complete len:399 (+) Transcript_48677:851-2047(+)
MRLPSPPLYSTSKMSSTDDTGLRQRKVPAAGEGEEAEKAGEAGSTLVTEKVKHASEYAEEEMAQMSAAMKQKLAEAERISKMLKAASEKAPPAMVKYLEMAAPVVAFVVVAFETALPLIAKALAGFDWFINTCPLDLLYAIFGFIICFFGGMYPTTIAAMEAWQQSGGETAKENMKVLYNEAKKVAEESAKDDAKDDDRDGVADVNQLDGKELLKRKAHLALVSCDPDTVNGAIQGIYTGWMGVLVVLKVEFAKTIALGVAIGHFINKPLTTVAQPVLVYAMRDHKDYHKWIPTIISYICKSIAISIAWYVQRIISAFHSAIRGGLMCSRGVLAELNKRGIIEFDEDESYIDEVIGWTLAALGFYFQFTQNFTVPFPLNFVLLPFSMVESYIIWTISD